MNFLSGYASDDDDADRQKKHQASGGKKAAAATVAAPAAPEAAAASTAAPSANKSRQSALARPKPINAAPDVGIESSAAILPYHDVSDRSVMFNPTFDILYKPVAGPANPFTQNRPNQNNLAGFVEKHYMADFNFETQRRTFHTMRYAFDPSAVGYSDDAVIGDKAKALENKGSTIWQAKQTKKDDQKEEEESSSSASTSTSTSASTSIKKKRIDKGDPSEIGSFLGPWAGYEGEKIGVPQENKDSLPKTTDESASKKKDEIQVGEERTIFHGKSELDYQGNTYMRPPMDLDVDLLAEPGINQCYIPKKLIHTWNGHTKGVNAIRFFPKTAHMFLSASMDSTIKIWDLYHERKVLRTYLGHNKAVRDVCFTNDGTKFISASYDRYLKLWDTETGKCISAFTNKKIPYCVKFNPDEDKQHIVLAGCADKKIIQWDINTGKIVQEYDQHLGAVNTITFIDENRRFVTTSDDKTLRAWEFDIPVVIKYIAEPDMHSMPAVAVHPNNKWLAFQSMDNQILIYGAKDRLRLNRKKNFKGHLVAGYACRPCFSSDGRFLMSGDSEGMMWFWDWKTCKLSKKFKAHDQVIMDCLWHPHETSKVLTASWDGTIKYWD